MREGGVVSRVSGVEDVMGSQESGRTRDGWFRRISYGLSLEVGFALRWLLDVGGV